MNATLAEKLEAALVDVALPPIDAYDDQPRAPSNGAHHAHPDDDRRFAYRLVGDVQAQIDTPYIVKNVLAQGALAVLFGESGTGKSHVALDIAMNVAQGTPALGRKTTRGAVLYIAGEGAGGLTNRLAAAREKGLIGADAPLAIIPRPVHLDIETGEPAALIRTIADLAGTTGEIVRLVVVDTLARCLTGDENTAADMGRFVQACDAVRTATSAAVLIVHHAGKDTTKGARGSSSLRAAVDTEILVEGRQNPRTITITKQRDLPVIDPLGFELDPITLGTDAEGEAVTACVMRLTEAPRPQPTGRNQQALLAAIREHARTTGCDLIATPDLREIAKAQGLVDRRRFGEVRTSLERDGWIVPAVGGYRVNGATL